MPIDQDDPDLDRIQDEQIQAMCAQERDKEVRRESGELPIKLEQMSDNTDIAAKLIDEGCDRDTADVIATAVRLGWLKDTGTKRNGKTVWLRVPPAEEMN
jgi:hypothetical protein